MALQSMKAAKEELEEIAYDLSKIDFRREPYPSDNLEDWKAFGEELVDKLGEIESTVDKIVDRINS